MGQVPAVLGDEFVPEDEAVATGQCPKYAELVSEGRGFRTPPQEWRSALCEAHLRLRIDGRVSVQKSRLRDLPDREASWPTFYSGWGAHALSH